MHLAFLKDLFSDYEIEIHESEASAWDEEFAYIKNPDFSEAITVYYTPDDYDIYCLKFATQHMHIANKEDLIDCIREYAEGKAAIEFFADGKNCFGGDIEAEKLNNLTYDSLHEDFGFFYRDMSNLTFKVYAWKKGYCFEGGFEKNKSGSIQVWKKPIEC